VPLSPDKRPGVETSLGDHETRIRKLERAKPPLPPPPPTATPHPPHYLSLFQYTDAFIPGTGVLTALPFIAAIGGQYPIVTTNDKHGESFYDTVEGGNASNLVTAPTAWTGDYFERYTSGDACMGIRNVSGMYLAIVEWACVTGSVGAFTASIQFVWEAFFGDQDDATGSFTQARGAEAFSMPAGGRNISYATFFPMVFPAGGAPVFNHLILRLAQDSGSTTTDGPSAVRLTMHRLNQDIDIS
jgi:hypothetical protein